MRYEDFNIRVMAKRDGGYDVSVDSPAGGATEHIKLPFEISDALTKVRGLGGTVRSASREANYDSGDTIEPSELGTQLYNALFSGAIGKMYNRSYAALSDPDAGLRIKLHLNLDDPGVSELAQIPWEYIYEADTMEYLTLSRQTPIVRYVEVQRASSSQKLPVNLKILVVMSSPKTVDALDLEKERKLIEDSWANEENVEVEFLEHPTPDSLLDALTQKQFHVMHYMGHGAYDHKTGAGALILEDEVGNAVMLDAQVLGTWLRDSPTIRLIFLNACDTAKADDEEPFSGVANRLVMAGVPAVLAMQFPISDEAAIDFARAFYPRLVAGFPVDEATAQGRKAILAGKTGTMEWGTPVLSMRAPDGFLFETQALKVDSQANQGGQSTQGAGQSEKPPLDRSNVGGTGVSLKTIGLGVAALFVAIGVAVFWPDSNHWGLSTQQLVVGEATKISVQLSESKEEGAERSSFDPDYLLKLTSDGPITIEEQPTPQNSTRLQENWDWIVTATEVAEEANIQINVSELGMDFEPYDVAISIVIDETAQNAFDKATASVADPAVSSLELLPQLRDAKDHSARLTATMNATLDEQISSIGELVELRASSLLAAADAQNVLLTDKIAALQSWKDTFETARFTLGGSEEYEPLLKLNELSERFKTTTVSLCASYGCPRNIDSIRTNAPLYVEAEPYNEGLTCTIVVPGSTATKECDPNKNAYRNLNVRGDHQVQIRNAEGDLIASKTITAQ